MLRQSNIHANPIIVESVEQLFDEDRQFERTERRLSFREAISRPVRIWMANSGEVINGFSKNISFEGVGVISKQEFEVGTEARIEIHSSQSRHAVFLSRLAWCRPFGDGWFVSGWRFITAIRS